MRANMAKTNVGKRDYHKISTTKGRCQKVSSKSTSCGACSTWSLLLLLLYLGDYYAGVRSNFRWPWEVGKHQRMASREHPTTRQPVAWIRVDFPLST